MLATAHEDSKVVTVVQLVQSLKNHYHHDDALSIDMDFLLDEMMYRFVSKQITKRHVTEELSELADIDPDLKVALRKAMKEHVPNIEERVAKRQAKKRLKQNMARWRLIGRMIGPLTFKWRRASERAYAPGGTGFEESRREFAALSGHKRDASELYK